MKKGSLILLLIIVTSGSFYYAVEVGWLAWLAPLPFLLLGSRFSSWSLFAMATLSYWIGSLSWWKAESFILSFPLFLSFHMIYALVFATLMVWIRNSKVVWLYPLGWTAFEFLVTLLSPHGTWGSVVYTQTDYLPLLQNAAILGSSGVVFLVCSFPAALAYVLQQRVWNKKMVGKAGLIILVLLLAATWGFFRIHGPLDDTQVRVGLTAANETVPHVRSEIDLQNILLVEESMSQIGLLKEQGVEIVVLPEKLFYVTSDYQVEVESIFAKAAVDNQVYLVVGIKLEQPDGLHNVAWVYAPTGERFIQYDKIHLIPGLEGDYVHGKRAMWLNDFQQRIGVAICKDLDFPTTIRSYGQEQVGLLLVPAWDWLHAEEIHARMAIVRGIENGFSIARTSKEGLVTVSDKYGRILAESSTFEVERASVITDVPISPTQTTYSRWGDWFAWFVVLITTVVGYRSSVRKKFISQ
ncbi:nitrilase-related carbon-nitrogen hydrolase [Rubeoparvulum massiliense]|uniref:nitrilase-related carbon-nitrogen hydrolase n=1 Tax=Rubeoparvulum massiliense TaxID=1631346 RepID=UPI00065E0AEA|nr:nitrilase-related carbon-nitrogen hydrolase [Rubeoparvulum massiliense]